VFYAFFFFNLNSRSNKGLIYQSLVGSVVIGAELGTEDHSSIPRNYDREGTET
jgi:hypothetical protein